MSTSSLSNVKEESENNKILQKNIPIAKASVSSLPKSSINPTTQTPINPSIQRNLVNLRTSGNFVNQNIQQAGRPVYRNIGYGGRPGYNNQVMPSIVYMALLVSPYKTPNSSEPSSLVITIPPMVNYTIRGLFYHPSFRSVTAAVAPQPGAKQVLRRFLIGPQLVRSVIAKNTAALKSLSANTAGYLAAGLVCGIPLYIVFTGAPVSLTKVPVIARSTSGIPSPNVNVRNNNETSFINSIQSSSTNSPNFQRSSQQIDSQIPPKPIPNTTQQQQQQRLVLSTSKNNKLSSSLPSNYNHVPPLPLQSNNNTKINNEKEIDDEKQKTMDLIEQLIAPENIDTNNSNNDNTTSDDIFSMFGLDDNSFNDSDPFSTEFWKKLSNSTGDDEYFDNTNINNTNNINISDNNNNTNTNKNNNNSIDNIDIKNINNSQNISKQQEEQEQKTNHILSSSSTPIHSISALPTPGSLQYSPLKKINLSGNVTSLSKKPLLNSQLRKSLHESATSPMAYIPPPSSPKSKKLLSQEKIKRKKTKKTSKKTRTKKKNLTPEWSMIDKALFQKALIRYGTSFGPIASCIGTKSSTNVKRYYHDNGGAKGYFKTLLNEHHYLKRQGILENFKTELTSNEQEYAMNNQGKLDLKLTYIHDTSRKRKRIIDNNSLPRGKKQKINDNNNNNIPNFIETYDPTTSMSYDQRYNYIKLKAEAILSGNERNDFSTPKVLEDHIFPSGRSNGIIKQDLYNIVHTDYSLKTLCDLKKYEIELAHKGNDDNTIINYIDTSMLSQNLKPKQNLDYQPFYKIIYENNLPLKSCIDSNNISSKPPFLHRSVSTSIIKHNKHQSILDPSSSSSHQSIDTIPPLAFDVDLSPHSDLTELSSSIWSPSSINDNSTSLSTSSPNIPFKGQSESFLKLSSKTPIFGKQGLFNFSHCKSLFNNSTSIISQEQEQQKQNNNTNNTNNNTINTTNSNIFNSSISPSIITIPRCLFRTKNKSNKHLMDIDQTSLNNNNQKLQNHTSNLYDKDSPLYFENLLSQYHASNDNYYNNSNYLFSYFNNSYQLKCLYLYRESSFQNHVKVDSQNQVYQISMDNLVLSCSCSYYNGCKIYLRDYFDINLLEYTPNTLFQNNNDNIFIEISFGDFLFVIIGNKIILYSISLHNPKDFHYIKQLTDHSSNIIYVTANNSFSSPHLATYDSRSILRIWNISSLISSSSSSTTNNLNIIPNSYSYNNSKDNFQYFEFKDIQRSSINELSLLWTDTGSWIAVYDTNIINLFCCSSNQRTPPRFSIKSPINEPIISICFSSTKISQSHLQIDKYKNLPNWLLISTKLKIYLYNLHQEKKIPINVSINTILSCMIITDIQGYSSKLYGIECTQNSIDNNRQDYLLIYSFNPLNKSKPLELQQRYIINNNKNITLVNQKPIEQKPISISNCSLKLSDNQTTIIYSSNTFSCLINLIPHTLHKLMYPAPFLDPILKIK